MRGFLQKCVEIRIMIKKLRNQMRGTCIDLFFQMCDIGIQVGRLRMSFRITCSGNVKIAVFPQECDQVGCIVKIVFRLDGRIAVAAERQDIRHTLCTEYVQLFEDGFLCLVDAGQMRNGRDAVAVLDRLADLRGRGTRHGAACAVGDADEIGAQVFQRLQCFVDAFDRDIRLRRKDLEGKHRLLLE